MALNLGLAGGVFLVSGGASGIGAAITRMLLDEGAAVVVVGRRTPAVDAVCAELAGKRFTFFEAELGDPEQCRQAIAQVEFLHGRLDGLVNNAGTNDSVGLANGTPAAFMESLRDNLLHCYALAHYGLELLKRSRGSIVTVGSKVALTGQGNTSAYAAAKGAQLALTREWAAELLPFGIRVNAVVPAEVMTPLYREWLDRQPDPAAMLEQITSHIPLGQRMTLDTEIAAAVLFLLSARQSGHTTAQQLVVDGGYTHLDRRLP